MRRFILGFVSLALVILGISSFLIWEFYLDDRLNKTDVVVATTLIEPNTRISEEHVQIQRRYIDTIPPNAYANVEEVVGKQFPFLLEPNEVLTSTKIEYQEMTYREKDIFPIPSSWIMAIPGTLNRLDEVDIYIMKESNSNASTDIEVESDEMEVLQKVKQYKDTSNPILEGIVVSYVKDGANQEIQIREGNENERISLSSNPQRVELYMEKEEFKILKQAIEHGYKLIFSY